MPVSSLRKELLTLLHSEWPIPKRVLDVLSAIGLSPMPLYRVRKIIKPSAYTKSKQNFHSIDSTQPEQKSKRF